MPDRHPPFPSPLAVHWQHDPSIVYLNHGSFGACPTAVLQAQQRLRNRMEAEAVRFFVEDYWSLMDRARAALGAFLHARPQDFAPIPNATYAVTTVLHHLARTGAIKAGDEVLVNDHEYPACLNNARDVCAMVGAAVVPVEIPFPVSGPEQVHDLIMSKVTPRTKAALLSHVTSPSGLILPVDRLVPELERRGVRTIIDGAHAAGFVRALDLSALGASYYTSNCHKWLCCPKGSAFLWVREDRQKGFRPLVLSNFAEKPMPGREPFLTEFDFVGTNDVTPFMAIPDAIEFMGKLFRDGWPAVFDHNRALLLKAREILCREWNVEPPAPESMLGNLCTLRLPEHPEPLRSKLAARRSRYHDALQEALIERHRIQVPVWNVAGKGRTIRISAQVYNSVGQYEYLAAAVAEELARERSAGSPAL